MDTVLVVAPHADDETLGCGGTLLRHAKGGDKLHWLLATETTKLVATQDRITEREKEIELVSKRYSFAEVHRLGYGAATLDQVPSIELVRRVSEVIAKISPSVVYLPYAHDAHSDHRIMNEAVAASSKWFRAPSIRKVLMYETLSETETSLLSQSQFSPNVYINVADWIEEKINILKLYRSEVAAFPFPRSEETVRALMKYRGSSVGYTAAEAFMLIREKM